MIFLIFAALSNSAIKKTFHLHFNFLFFEDYWHNINYMQKVGSEPLKEVSRYENICISESTRYKVFTDLEGVM